MEEQSKWVRHRFKCPEGKGESKLFIEWRIEDEREIINSISCDNLYLKDLSGGDCQWSCWEKFSSQND